MSQPDTTYPSPDDLLPHSGPLNLLSELVDHDRNGTTCRFRLRTDHVFYRNGQVPICYGIEFLGQCGFYHYLLNRYENDQPEKKGLFLGGRKINVTSSEFDLNTSYIVYAEDFGMNDRFFAARGHIYPEGNESKRLLEGRLNALLIDHEESLLDGHKEQFT